MNHKYYETKTDEELLLLFQNGETEVMDFLLEKYKYLVRRKANTMFLLGGETEDLIQEGMIGLFKAIRDYRQDKDSSFATFASICVTRQIYKAVEAASRKKHGPLNSYVSLSVNDDSEVQNQVPYPLKASTLNDPENLLISQEEMEQFFEKVNQVLSPLERKTLRLHLLGNNYHQISEVLGKPEKSIDNALQRVKKKVNQLMEHGL